MNISNPNDVYDKISSMRDDIEKMFNTIMQPKTQEPIQKKEPVLKDSLKETDNSLIGVFNLPSLSEDQIELDIRNNTIGIIAKRKVQNEIASAPGSQKIKIVKKVLPLPRLIDPEKTIALYKDGVLKLDMPKINTKPKKVRLQ
jgi:HSP20 family molecular chaperone IbpA